MIDFCWFACLQDVRALGFFELQILEIENYRGQLATGECCGGGGGAFSAQQQSASSTSNRYNASTLQCVGAPQCNTLFRVCLREYQSRHPQLPASASGSAAAISGGRMGGSDDDSMATGINHHQPNSQLHHCSFGNVTSAVLGGNSFTLGSDAATAASETSSSDSSNREAAGGNLALPFSFSWTVSTMAFVQTYL